MKKYLLLVIALFMLSFAMRVYSACEPGYTSASKTITIGGCDYQVNFCWKCITPGFPLCIMIDEFTRLNPNCDPGMTTGQVYMTIYQYLLNNDVIFEYCNDSIPPCGTGQWLHILFMTPKCWYKQLINGNIHVKKCDVVCNCCVPWKYCWNTHTMQRERWSDGSPFWDGSDCNTGCPNPEVADPTWRNPITGCFYLTTPCD